MYILNDVFFERQLDILIFGLFEASVELDTTAVLS